MDETTEMIYNVKLRAGVLNPYSLHSARLESEVATIRRILGPLESESPKRCGMLLRMALWSSSNNPGKLNFNHSESLLATMS